MESFNQIIFVIASSLLIPVIIILTFLFIKSLLSLGVFYGNYADRMKFKKNIKPLLKQMEDAQVDLPKDLNQRHILSKHLQEMVAVNWHPVKGEKVLSDMELAFKKQLEKPKLIMRAGPMLGLMGTLIPMGPALAGLASGDIANMAINMQLAFATTVIGIFIGLVGFIVLEIQKRWAAEDFSELEYLYNLKSDTDA